MNRSASPRALSRVRTAMAASVLSIATASLAQAPSPAKLPQRNLLVEVRQGDASRFGEHDAGLRSGSVTLGTDGSVQARGGVTFEARSRDASADAVTTLRVLNGAQGMLSVGTSVPVVWFEVVLTANGPAAIGTQRLQDTGRRVAVRPSWPGGNAPVTVEVRTESGAVATGGVRSRYQFDGQPLPQGAVETAGLLTTLQLPLGVWTTVASDASSVARREQGTLSSTDATGERRYVVQMRVTAP